MRVLFVTSEAHPLAKSGGLADVSRSLPIALLKRNIDVRILMPGYPAAIGRLDNPRLEVHLGAPRFGAIISGVLPESKVPVWLLHAPSLFSRGGGLYQDGKGNDWPDNAQRFAALCQIASEIARGQLLKWQPDVVHANDWHTGLIPLLLKMKPGSNPGTVFTIHNLAFQGNFPAEQVPDIPARFLTPDEIEFYGNISYLKAAIRYSDKITTVSPGYAAEILTPGFGCGLHGVLQTRLRDFCGILNGIDTQLWNPLTDPYLPERFGMRDISGKRACKLAIQGQMGLAVQPGVPLIVFISRIAHQKMADVLLGCVPTIIRSGAQLAVLGEGDAFLEGAFVAAAQKYREKIAVRIGYDEGLAHRLQGGADILLAPARFEPCGLTQLYGLRYGAVPIVRRTGGLADTVSDIARSDRNATGFVFDDPTSEGLMGAITRALALYKEPLSWRRLQLRGMSEDFGWDVSADRYMSLYHEICDTPDTTVQPIEHAVRQAASS